MKASIYYTVKQATQSKYIEKYLIFNYCDYQPIQLKFSSLIEKKRLELAHNYL